jgi:hypothetical protein
MPVGFENGNFGAEGLLLVILDSYEIHATRSLMDVPDEQANVHFRSLGMLLGVSSRMLLSTRRIFPEELTSYMFKTAASGLGILLFESSSDER